MSEAEELADLLIQWLEVETEYKYACGDRDSITKIIVRFQERKGE